MIIIVRPFDIGNVTFPAEAVFNIIKPLDSCKAVAAGRYVWTEPLQAGQTYKVHYGGKVRCISNSSGLFGRKL